MLISFPFLYLRNFCFTGLWFFYSVKQLCAQHLKVGSWGDESIKSVLCFPILCSNLGPKTQFFTGEIHFLYLNLMRTNLVRSHCRCPECWSWTRQEQFTSYTELNPPKWPKIFGQKELRLTSLNLRVILGPLHVWPSVTWPASPSVTADHAGHQNANGCNGCHLFFFVVSSASGYSKESLYKQH